MPTKRIFDLVVLSSILLHPAVGLLKMSARRWSREMNGPIGTLGDAMVVGL
jgi:hypothetical protein